MSVWSSRQPFKIINEQITGHYSAFCISKNCPSRRPIGGKYLRQLTLLSASRIVFLIIVSGIFGANIAFMSGQGMGDRVTRVEMTAQTNSTEIVLLRQEVEQTRQDIATMRGYGLGIAGTALGLQVLQILFGRKIRIEE